MDSTLVLEDMSRNVLLSHMLWLDKDSTYTYVVSVDTHLLHDVLTDNVVTQYCICIYIQQVEGDSHCQDETGPDVIHIDRNMYLPVAGIPGMSYWEQQERKPEAYT